MEARRRDESEIHKGEGGLGSVTFREFEKASFADHSASRQKACGLGASDAD